MKHIALVLVLIVSAAFAGNIYALDQPSKDKSARICYGYSMVAFDSVINSRLGVPAEYALGLALKNAMATDYVERYSINVLRMVLNAYLWAGTPHEYSLQVFDHCAKVQGSYADASLD